MFDLRTLSTELKCDIEALFKQQKSEITTYLQAKLEACKADLTKHFQDLQADITKFQHEVASEARLGVSKKGGSTVATSMKDAGVEQKSKRVVLVLKPSAEGPVIFLKKGTSEVQAMKAVQKEAFKPFRPRDAHADFIFEVITFNRGDAGDELILKEPHKLVRFMALEDWSEKWGRVCESLAEQLYKCEQCEEALCSYMIQ